MVQALGGVMLWGIFSHLEPLSNILPLYAGLNEDLQRSIMIKLKKIPKTVMTHLHFQDKA